MGTKLKVAMLNNQISHKDDSDFTIQSLEEGCRLPVKMSGTDEFAMAEVLGKKKTGGVTQYYVHYLEFNKRLDEWVTTERMQLDAIQHPGDKKTPSASACNSGATTPRRASVLNPPSVTDPLVTTSTAQYINRLIDELQSKTQKISSSNSEISEPPETDNFSSSRAQVTNTSHEPMKNIQSITIGRYTLDTWYYSPYPRMFHNMDSIVICEFCLSPKKSSAQLISHREKCKLRHPPGVEIYRCWYELDGKKKALAFFEIDGHQWKWYARNLCLLAKLFLDHKTLRYDTDPFLFYCLAEWDEYGAHLIGYFSKEKISLQEYNVACILTLPQYQRMGYGTLLIEFSYELTKREGKTGSPEKPLSDLGLLSYRRYWARKILEFILPLSGKSDSSTNISEICEATGIRKEDVIWTLEHNLKILKWLDDETPIFVTRPELKEQYGKSTSNSNLKVDPRCLQWKPTKFSE